MGGGTGVSIVRKGGEVMGEFTFNVGRKMICLESINEKATRVFENINYFDDVSGPEKGVCVGEIVLGGDYTNDTFL